uniref:Putative secreted protein n=1 Tax=Anopheles darlingi TaxID=43151 RepID=A0A2M4DB48_ANODA
MVLPQPPIVKWPTLCTLLSVAALHGVKFPSESVAAISRPSVCDALGIIRWGVGKECETNLSPSRDVLRVFAATNWCWLPRLPPLGLRLLLQPSSLPSAPSSLTILCSSPWNGTQSPQFVSSRKATPDRELLRWLRWGSR